MRLSAILAAAIAVLAFAFGMSPLATSAQTKGVDAPVRALIEAMADGKVTDPEFSVNGNEVVVRGQYSSRGYSSKADFLFTVENGLITSWRMRY